MNQKEQNEMPLRYEPGCDTHIYFCCQDEGKFAVYCIIIIIEYSWQGRNLYGILPKYAETGKPAETSFTAASPLYPSTKIIRVALRHSGLRNCGGPCARLARFLRTEASEQSRNSVGLPHYKRLGPAVLRTLSDH